ncbi:uncharacterized protein LOC123501748 isoform X2 [Portunus trituberculatus]|uniref:uncharacterized protein LOC123501748 isoform X2 n=1 Tax=Portunus trituberculatus TaxID=210409 RepID=UPI001E1CF7E7|nr:uncharacterized protein LOC123501748 isoform X2 [Portunus trituberculatus]
MKPDEENMDVEARRLTQPQGGGAKSRRAARHRTNETETMNGADVNTELLNRGDAMPVITSRPVNRRNRRTSPRSQLVEDGARDRINTHTNSDRESSSNSCSSGAGGGTPRGRQLDTLLKNSDDRGAYKRFLILWWLVPVCLVVPCAYLNVLLMVQVPLSNCTVPPPPGHLSTYHWRLLVTPKTQTGELNPCALYDFSSALSDPQYDPGTSRQYSTRTYNTTYDDQIGPSTPQPRLSTPWEDTGGLKTPPGTVDRESDDTEGFTSIPVDSYTLGTNTGPVEAVTTSEVPGITKGTAEEHPSTPGQQGEALEQHLSTQNQHSTTTDGSSTIDHQGSTRKHHFSTHKGGLSTPNQQISTRTQHSTTRQHHSTTEHTTRHKLTNTHTQTVSSKESDPTQPGLVKSRVARHFDPFNDLYVSGRKKEGGEGGAKQDDPMEKYLKAAVKWQKEYPGVAPPMVYTMGCVFGHDFDKTYVEKSLATELGWACEEAGNSTRMLYVCVAGAVIGSLLFGILADRVGRKWVLMLLAVKAAALGSLFVLVKSSLTLLILRFFISLGLPAIYNVVVITALEQVRDEERGMVTCLASVCFSLGQCVLGFLGWLLGSWVTLGLVTSLPCVLALAYSRLLEESPQWLVARGRGKEAALVLRRITMRNHPRNPLAPSLLLLQTRIKKIRGGEAEQFEQAGMCQGVCSLLIGVGEFLASYPRLCFRMVLLTVCWIRGELHRDSRAGGGGPGLRLRDLPGGVPAGDRASPNTNQELLHRSGLPRGPHC